MPFLSRWILSTCLLFMPFSALATPDDTKEKVILDQDAFGPATSNLQGLLMFIQSPKVDVLGITVMSGDG